ncbi:MAG: Lactamase protein [Bacteroidota bacterium]|nr:Lactamase protein [Bacteroidota bacterium]
MKKTFLAINLAVLLILAGCCTFSADGYHGAQSANFDGVQFHNTDSSESRNSFLNFLWWRLTRQPGYWLDWHDNPIFPPPSERVGISEIKAAFIGHATVLLQCDSLNILTDPVFSDNIGPFILFNQKRKMPPGIRFENLPPIDIVLVSHNHFDHLDLPSLQRLQDRYHPLILVPLGSRQFLEENGITNVREFDWWNDTIIANHLKITFVPSRHFSRRGLCDGDNTLWGGYVIEADLGNIYFAGDTGFGSHFAEIVKKFGSFSLSLLPIAPIEPRWFMKDIHLDPAEAVEAHILLHSRYSMAIHFGTFQQTDDSQFEPGFELERTLRERGISLHNFILPIPGKGYKIR